MTKPDLQNLGERYTLAPDILLTPSGPQRDMAISVANGKIVAVAPARTMPDAIKLPQQAIVPGFVDAHTHLGQAFGKSFVFGEPSQIWQRIW